VVFLSVYTNGCFDCVPPNTSATLGGLNYVNATFPGT
jgi:hypothetical protein